jgi:hypothetical protein
MQVTHLIRPRASSGAIRQNGLLPRLAIRNPVAGTTVRPRSAKLDLRMKNVDEEVVLWLHLTWETGILLVCPGCVLPAS